MSYVTISAAPVALRDSVLDLWSKNFPEGSADRYEWLYERGPAHGWLLRDEQDRTVGGAGMMVRTVRAEGRTLAAGQAIDMNVDREHRTAGPAIALARNGVADLRSARFDFLYAFPNALSIPILRRVGYEVVGPLGRWAKPLSLRHFAAEGNRPWLRGIPSICSTPLLALGSREIYPLRFRGLLAGVTDLFDGRVDALWEKVASRWNVMGERTAGYLNWRFAGAPVTHRIYFVASGDGGWRGYLVYHFRGRMAYVSDFLFDGPETFDLLWGGFLRLMRSGQAQGVVTLFLGDETVTRRLRRFGFWRRPCDWSLLVAADRQRRQEDLASLFTPSNWYLTRADIDTDF